MPLSSSIFHYIPLYPIIFHYIPLYSIIFHYIPLYAIIFHYLPVYSIMFHYIPTILNIFPLYSHYIPIKSPIIFPLYPSFLGEPTTFNDQSSAIPISSGWLLYNLATFMSFNQHIYQKAEFLSCCTLWKSTVAIPCTVNGGLYSL